MSRKSRIHYVVKVNGISKLDSYISRINEFPSIVELVFDYKNRDKVLEVKVLSKKKSEINYTKLLSSLANHANSGNYEIRLEVNERSILDKILMNSSKNILSLSMDYLGCIKNLKSSRSKQMI